ncbi:MAG: hypothetical protein PVH88_12165 [Ignavibacteria bacterium]
MKKNVVSLVSVFFILGVTSSVFSRLIDGYQGGLKYINREDIKNTTIYLASDDMKGRAAGTEENLQAARFIARKFYGYGFTSYADLLNPDKADSKK